MYKKKVCQNGAKLAKVREIMKTLKHWKTEKQFEFFVKESCSLLASSVLMLMLAVLSIAMLFTVLDQFGFTASTHLAKAGDLL